MKNKYHHKLIGKIIGRMTLVTIIYTTIFLITSFLGYIYCKQFVWQPSDPLYNILNTINNNQSIYIFIWLIGFIIIVIIFLIKTLSYINHIVESTQSLISNDDIWIELPKDLVEVEETLNKIKQESLHNARLAKQNEQKKDDLIVYLAHDIKTPLTSMIGYLSLLEEIEDMPLEQRKKYTKVALNKSYQLEELINELFDITRFNSERIILEKDEINLNLMLEQIIDDFYPILTNLKKQIIFNTSDKVQINADSDKLARVFNNIIKNAINYSKKESSIKINMKKNTNTVTIQITNEGQKISDENLQKLFDKFYRMDDARTTKTGGSGLGLAIAKEIIQLHQGKINVTSNETETTFTIILPLT